MEHLCPSCQTKITNRRSDAVYCSEACKQANYRKRREQAITKEAQT